MQGNALSCQRPTREKRTSTQQSLMAHQHHITMVYFTRRLTGLHCYPHIDTFTVCKVTDMILAMA